MMKLCYETFPSKRTNPIVWFPRCKYSIPKLGLLSRQGLIGFNFS